MDEEGFIYFSGHSDDIISSAGYRIGPFEVESALMGHEAVAEAAVVGIPNERRGEIEFIEALPKTPSGKIQRFYSGGGKKQ